MNTTSTPDLLSFICKAPGPNFPSHEGGKEFRETDIAYVARAIQAFRTFHKIDPTNGNTTIGVSFSLAKLQKFIDTINQYNQSVSVVSKIDAIRIYSTRHPYSRPNHSDVDVDNIVFVPVQTDDQDVFNVNKFVEPDIYMLGDGTPCPNLCNKYFFNLEEK